VRKKPFSNSFTAPDHFTGRWGSIAEDTLNKFSVFTERYEQLFESELGALIYIGYQPGISMRSRSEERGDGQATILVATLGPRMNNVLR
jgi:hypothetical protein